MLQQPITTEIQLVESKTCKRGRGKPTETEFYCGRVLPLTSFTKGKSSCKECSNKKTKLYNETKIATIVTNTLQEQLRTDVREPKLEEQLIMDLRNDLKREVQKSTELEEQLITELENSDRLEKKLEKEKMELKIEIQKYYEHSLKLQTQLQLQIQLQEKLQAANKLLHEQIQKLEEENRKLQLSNKAHLDEIRILSKPR
jgi:DNA repair exonuclease SbcCD ATPase subunit